MSADRDAFLHEVDVSRETLERLDTYANLVGRWTPRINLISRASLETLWTRHFLDSAQLCDLAPKGPRLWADLGSGGGFPGIVVAILLAERPSVTEVLLVESDQRKAVFLRTVIQETGVRARVVAARIEDVAPLGADVLSARALAPLPALLAMAERHLAPGGVALFPKGAGWKTEVAESLARWRFHCEEIPSRTAPEAVILRIGDIHRV